MQALISFGYSFAFLFGFSISLLTGFIAARELENKDYLSFGMGSVLFLICLIGFSYLIIQLMIEDSVIIQVDATMIAGLLILLSITKIWTKKQEIITHQITKTKGIYWTPRQLLFPIVPFSISAMAILVNFVFPDFMRYLSVSMCAAGFFFIMIIALLIASKDRIIKTPLGHEPTFDTKKNSEDEP
jgi:hypothetical protein